MFKIGITDQVAVEPLLAAISGLDIEREVYIQSGEEEPDVIDGDDSVNVEVVSKLPHCNVIFTSPREEINTHGFQIKIAETFEGENPLFLSLDGIVKEGQSRICLANFKYVLISEVLKAANVQKAQACGHFSASWYEEIQTLVDETASILNGNFSGDEARQVAFNSRFVAYQGDGKISLLEYAMPCFYGATIDIFVNQKIELQGLPDFFELRDRPFSSIEASGAKGVAITLLDNHLGTAAAIHLAFDPVVVQSLLIEKFLNNNLDVLSRFGA